MKNAMLKLSIVHWFIYPKRNFWQIKKVADCRIW